MKMEKLHSAVIDVEMAGRKLRYWRRAMLDDSLTFGGFHFNNLREMFVELRYRFHY
jgi:hypothetical protein